MEFLFHGVSCLLQVNLIIQSKEIAITMKLFLQLSLVGTVFQEIRWRDSASSFAMDPVLFSLLFLASPNDHWNAIPRLRLIPLLLVDPDFSFPWRREYQ